MGNHPHDGSGGRRSRRRGQTNELIGGDGTLTDFSRQTVATATESTGAGGRLRHLPRSGLVQRGLSNANRKGNASGAWVCDRRVPHEDERDGYLYMMGCRSYDPNLWIGTVSGYKSVLQVVARIPPVLVRVKL